MFVSGEKWFFTYILDLIVTKSIYSLRSYQHSEPFLQILLVMRKLLFKSIFNNEITRIAANEAQLGKSVVSASSVHVLLTCEELSSSHAFDFQQQGRDGSCVRSHTLNL